jgi:hypothetical protein
LLKTQSLTPLFRQNAQNDPKTHSYEDSAKFNSTFSATRFSHASRFRQKRRVIENFEYLGEYRIFLKMLAVLRFASVSD